MKKRVIWWILAAAILVLSVVVYFRPLAFTDIVTEQQDVCMILSIFSIQNGEPDIEMVEYQDITAEEKRDILAVMEQHSYRRTVGTLFSDGTIEDLGERMLTIHVMEGEASDSIVVTDSGKIAVNDKVYRMKDADEMMEKLLEVVE